MSSQFPASYSVKFSEDVARVLECETPGGRIDFTVDSGSGDGSVCLEHHPANWPRSPTYDLAFEAAKRYLESCGYQVEVHGQ